MSELLRAALHRYSTDPRRVAVVDADRPVTYAELAARCAAPPGDPADRVRVLRVTGRADDVRDVVRAALWAQATLVVDAGATPWESARVDREFAAARGAAAGDPTLFLCTSGSSGLPAVVAIPWAGCLDNSLAFARAAGFAEGDRIWCTTPLHHRFCLAGGVLAGLLVGATVVLKPGAVGPGELRDTLVGDRITTILSVPFLFRRYADGLARDPALLSRWQVRTCIAAGETVPGDLVARWSTVTGRPLLPHYGSTEDGQISIGCGEPDEGVGRPLSDTEVSTDPDGQLLVRRCGTAAWRATADRGHLDARGNVHVTGRIGDRINVAGKKVDPVEVESALRLHPSVRDSALVALPGGPSGPELVAFVVTAGGPPDPQDLRRHAAALLSPYKVRAASSSSTSSPDRAPARYAGVPSSKPHSVAAPLVGEMRTQVAIIGAGPAGLVLAALLTAAGIESVVIEARSREHIEGRVRAGVMEHPSVELLRSLGLAARLDTEGMRHDGVRLRFGGATHRLDFAALTGRSITVYGQQELVKDLVAGRLAAGDPVLFEASGVLLSGLSGDRPQVSFAHRGAAVRLDCDFVAGCDGFHGVSRSSVPDGVWTTFDRTYPLAWLGVLVDAAPSSDEIVYANHRRGFALHSMRSPATVRQYLQVAPDALLGDWPDEQIWAELRARLDDPPGFVLNEGPIIERAVTALRAFVCEPMQYERLFLLGDAAHIVPPTGAKGMNLAIHDASVLSRALAAHYAGRPGDLLAGYSATCLRRVWQAQRFSWEMTTMLHRFADAGPMDERLQRARLDHLTTSEPAARALAAAYVGAPFDPA